MKSDTFVKVPVLETFPNAQPLKNRTNIILSTNSGIVIRLDVDKVSTAIATAKQEAISAATEAAAADATGKANQALADAKTDAEAKYVTKTYVGEIPSKDGAPEADNVIAFVEKRAAEVLSQATGGSSESAASVKGQLDTFKAEINPKVTKNTEDIATVMGDYLKKTDIVSYRNVIEALGLRK